MERSLILAAALAGLAGAADATQPVFEPGRRAGTGAVAPQADPAIALRRELAAALAAGTSAALILFLARHPDTAEAGTARAALERREPDPAPPGGPDGDIVAAFDRARPGGPAALDAFAARYPNHPLAAEAGRWSRWLRDGKGAAAGDPGKPVTS